VRCVNIQKYIYIVHSPTIALFITLGKVYNLHQNTHKYRTYMFRSTTTIREFVLSLAKVILKHSVKLRRYMLFGDVAVCHRAECVLCAVQNETVR
jgi:hypothetical protein